jgi:hypothetical protein
MTIPVPRSAITAPNNTPAGRLRGQPEPVRTHPPAVWRTRRRQRLITARVQGFSPSGEIADAAGPLAARIAALDAPLRLRRWVLGYADAGHEFVSALIGWQAEADGRAKTTHLANEPGKRQYATTLIKDLAQRPPEPVISDQMIVDGSWPALLTEMAAAADGLRVATTYSDRLETLLRDTIDRAALDLDRKIAWAESNPLPDPSKPLDPRAALAALGIETT